MGCKRGTRKTSNSKRGGKKKEKKSKERSEVAGLKEGMDEHGVKR